MQVESVAFVKLSEVMEGFDDIELNSESITWGDANRTLITTDRFLNEIDCSKMDNIPCGLPLKVIERIANLPDGVLIDMEN